MTGTHRDPIELMKSRLWMVACLSSTPPKPWESTPHRGQYELLPLSLRWNRATPTFTDTIGGAQHVFEDSYECPGHAGRVYMAVSKG